MNEEEYRSRGEVWHLAAVLCRDLCSDVRQRIQQRIAQAFGISSASMYLTKPTFFSRINSTEAKTTHDEYWHPHVDKVSRRLRWGANVSCCY